MTGNPAQRTLLLLLLALAVLGALGAWLWRGTNEPVLAPGEASPEQAVAQDADFARGDGPGEAASAAPQDAAATGEHRTAPAGDGAPARPFPSDAQWLEITVVDATDRTPVAAAEVWWYGAESFAELNEAEGGWSAEAMLLGQDPQAAARRFGWSSRSDAAGKVRVTLRTATVVLAEHDGRYGELQLRENTLPPSNGWQLLLEPDQHLTVRVVDERDQPCAEVPVTLVGIDRDGDVWGGLGWMPLATSTAPDGLATIPHLRHLLRRLQDGRGDLPDGLQVRPSLYLPGARLDHPPIDSANPPREPIVLRLPACGAVAVRAAVLGRPMAEFRNAWLTHQPPDDGGEGTAGGVARHHVSVWQKADAQGVVRFQRVLLGQQYTVYTEAGGGLMQQFAGPVRAGQEVEVVLTVAPNVALLRGRLVEPDGTPAREVAFEFLARGEDLWQHQTGKTDRDGRFTVAAGQLDEPTQADWLWFDVGGSRGSNAGSSAPRRRATAPPRMLRAGSDELGDLVLAEAPLLVAGRIEREGGPVPKGLNCWVVCETRNAETGETDGEYTFGQYLQVDDDGSFTVRGTAGRGQHQLLPARPQEPPAHRPPQPARTRKSPGKEPPNQPVPAAPTCVGRRCPRVPTRWRSTARSAPSRWSRSPGSWCRRQPTAIRACPRSTCGTSCARWSCACSGPTGSASKKPGAWRCSRLAALVLSTAMRSGATPPSCCCRPARTTCWSVWSAGGQPLCAGTPNASTCTCKRGRPSRYRSPTCRSCRRMPA